MKKMLFSICLAAALIIGCTNEQAEDWKPAPTFSDEGLVMHGTEGKFGMVKMNGEADEPDFPAGQGRLYQVYFLEDDFSGQQYHMTAVKQDTDVLEDLYEQAVGNGESAVKFGFDEAGLWKIAVYVDGEPYTDFIVEAE